MRRLIALLSKDVLTDEDITEINALLTMPSVVSNIAAHDNAALRAAARNGHLGVVNCLLGFPAVVGYSSWPARLMSGWVNRLLGVPKVVDITARENEALCLAASNGHLAVVNRLLEFPAVIESVTAFNNSALRGAAEKGRLAVVDRLLEFPAVVENITAFDNYALCCAASNGHLAVVNRLLEFPAVVQNITGFANYALRRAAEHGHLAVVNRLLEFPAVVENITAMESYALRFAVGSGHLAVVNRLLEFQDVIENISAIDNYALRFSARYGYLAVVNRLLEFPVVVANITALDNHALRGAALGGHLAVVNRLLEFPTVVENITAEENYALCFAAQNGYLAVVNRLLEFPAVVENVTAQRNYALRLAHVRHRTDVVERLMQYPAVRQAVLDADNASVSLRAIAQDTENAMRALNLHEQGIVNALKKRYPSLSNEMAQADVLNDLREHLEAICQGEKVSLSFDKNYPKLPLSNVSHQAWRYLFARPNPWMSPNASFVEVTEQGRQAAINPKDWNLVALIWQLLNDKDAQLNEDNADLIENGIATSQNIRSGLKETFINTLALLGRAHNYDHDEKDDGELDKPSCSMGVTQRLLLGTSGFSIADKPDTRPFSPNHIATRLKEQLVTHPEKGVFPVIQGMVMADLSNLKETLDNLLAGSQESELRSEEQALLAKLAISPDEVNDFIEDSKDFYSALRFQALGNINYQGEHYDNADVFIKAIAAKPWVAFLAEVYQFVSQALETKAKEQYSGIDMNVATDVIENDDLEKGKGIDTTSMFNRFRKRLRNEGESSSVSNSEHDDSPEAKKPKCSPAA